MKKLLLVPVLFLSSIIYTLSSVSLARAVAPERPYVLAQNFSLLRFINPRLLRVYENRDRDRTYPPLMVCGYAGADTRPDECVSGPGADKMCTGSVDICNRQTGEFHHTESNVTGTCRVPKVVDANGDKKDPPPGTPGKCDYTTHPTTVSQIKSTDYSNTNKSTITYPKLQNDASFYDNIGSDNLITWGSHNLLLDNCSRTIRQLMVVIKAKQTKATVNETGQWPLGWVDWEYETPSGKTLVEINDELPDGVAGAGKSIVEALDTFYSTVGNTTKDTSSKQQDVCDAWNAAQKPGGGGSTWAQDLALSPVYPPAIKQGFARGSICVYDRCCPSVGSTCPILMDDSTGGSQALYTDASIQQTYAAALDDLFINYPYQQALDIYHKLVIQNPPLRWALRTDPPATPPEIRKKLEEEMKNVAWLQALPSGLGFKLNWIGSTYDYQHKMDAYGYKIQPTLDKRLGGAYYENPLQALIDVIWPPSNKVDIVEPITHHILSIPEVMGQSIAELQEQVYDTRDTLQDLSDKYNQTISSTIDNGSPDKLYVGKELGPGNAQRNLALTTCADPYYSAPQLTTIEQYALGNHVGCDSASTVPVGTCDGKLFAKLIENSKYQQTSAKGSDYFNNSIKGTLTADLMNTYAAAEKATGVPCEILAGIHFVEADNNPDSSLVSGRKIGTPEPDAGGKVFHSLLETAIYAGHELKGKVGGNIKDANSAITALSRYNGGGNSNCQLGYPYPIPYGGCPRLFEGEDDPYPVSFLDNKHDSMYLLYCADYTACAPQIFERPGSFTVALNVYNNMTKSGYDSNQLPPPTPKPPTTTTPGNPTLPTGFFPKSCGPESLSTALGCLPFTRDAFVSTLLSFIVGIAGAIALAVMLVGTFQIMTAAGDAKKVQKGRELFTAALFGLLFLIFSVSLLRIIAGSIIKLPGF